MLSWLRQLFSKSEGKYGESQAVRNSVEDTLAEHERRLEIMARRLRILEIEVGIYKPPVRGSRGTP